MSAREGGDGRDNDDPAHSRLGRGGEKATAPAHIDPPVVGPARRSEVPGAVDQEIHATQNAGVQAGGQVVGDVVQVSEPAHQAHNSPSRLRQRLPDQPPHVPAGTGDGRHLSVHAGSPLTTSLPIRWELAMTVSVNVVEAMLGSTEASTRWTRSQPWRRPHRSVSRAPGVAR